MYYYYEYAVRNCKQELFVINGTSEASRHLEEKHQIDPKSGIKKNSFIQKSVLDQQKGTATASNFFWKDSVEKFKELLIH